MPRDNSNRADKKVPEQEELAMLQKVTRFLEILVRLTLQGRKGSEGQPALISMLDEIGCGPTEIADLLGTTANTVNVSLYRTKRKAKKK
jgi:DNA-directed RNA polymerase specialized sigma24 family protein